MSKTLEDEVREGFTHGLTDLVPNNRPVNQCTKSLLVSNKKPQNQINYSMTVYRTVIKYINQ